jgi:putative addiction module antidote
VPTEKLRYYRNYFRRHILEPIMVHIMVQLKIVKVGNSLGVRLPREVLNRMHLGDGDKLILTEAPEGGYRLSPYDPEFERQMQIAEEGMRKYRNTLHELAK